MKNWKEVVHHTTFRYLDHTEKNFFHGQAYTALTSFAVDDVLALSAAGTNANPALRLWVHPDTVVLGIPDARLPHLEEGIQLLSNHGYRAIVRNSGGLAVALDTGVLNISLVLPDVRGLSIHDCYEAMVSFIQYMLRDLTDAIEAYEIVGSYCPGDYDLSINGRKFAGISQRRVKDGAAIQIYLDVEGKGRERAELIRDFYDVARKEEETSFDYPEINPSVMASLSELLGIKLTVDDMKQRVLNALEDVSEELVSNDFSEDELVQFEKRYEQMVKRNEKTGMNGQDSRSGRKD
ncbi:lipoate--protein ligase family protein [Lentibacillus cibarius]|uniref:Octanoyl-[GcvH]:protein N-octanoyltransferase n=1 Tax=Lentibacillus cibarius TaxID=2583219 RepID=A0A5S3QJN7_9BACI|nr:lipoate--protein ligase family protein [Lentibacillus cibarius]TMN22038.1 lipoate--protein ligase family protein [Lentibacillus cibarius]